MLRQDEGVCISVLGENVSERTIGCEFARVILVGFVSGLEDKRKIAWWLLLYMVAGVRWFL